MLFSFSKMKIINYYMKTKKNQKKNKSKKNKTMKKQFLYNPNNPEKSFDVYIDKNPSDTIPIKYSTPQDVKDTIKKLERLYKSKNIHINESGKLG